MIRVSAELCNKPSDSLQGLLEGFQIITAIIPAVMISLRVVSRLMGGSKLWWDDWLHIFATVRTRWIGRIAIEIADTPKSYFLSLSQF